MGDTFTCAQCGGTFAKAWSDAESEAEAKALFGYDALDDPAVLCEPCWQAFMRWYEGQG